MSFENENKNAKPLANKSTINESNVSLDIPDILKKFEDILKQSMEPKLVSKIDEDIKIANIFNEAHDTGYRRVRILRNMKLLTFLFDNIIREDGFICGGFARVCTSTNKEIIPSGDIDIYCKNKDSFDRIANRLETNGYFEHRKSETALTMHHSFNGSLPVQLIMPLNEGHVLLSSENIEEILNNFDFSIARVGITSASLLIEQAIADKDFVKDEETKRLNIKNIHCPIAQIYRVSKYMEKGYWLPMAQILRIFADWDNRDPDYKRKITDVSLKQNPTKEEIQELEKLLHID